MRAVLKERYATLVEFLSQIFGPHYEIALHDLSLVDHSIIAIANGHITGRTIGDTIKPQIREFLEDKRYLHEDYKVNYLERTDKDRTLRSSTLFIMDDLELVGLLCITFDDEKFRNVSQEIMRLCHPDYLLSGNFQSSHEIYKEDLSIEKKSVETSSEKTLNFVRKKYKIGTRNLTKKDRMQIVKELKTLGFFDMKGAVEECCALIGVSIATIYRYLTEINYPK